MARLEVIVASACDADRLLLAHLLKDGELSVREIASESQLLEVTACGHGGLVILDTLSWPDSVVHTLATLKRAVQPRDIPVMVFGRPASPDEVTGAMQAGASTWFNRSGFAAELFIERVRSLLQGDKAPAAQADAKNAEAPVAAPVEGLAGHLTPDHVREVLAEAGSLKVFEATITEAITTTCEKADLADHITGIVMRDPMLAVTVLGRANQLNAADSPTIADTREAIGKLGERNFYQLAQSLSPLRFNVGSLWDPGHLWLHSVATSRIAVMLSRLLGLGRCAEVANAALLHDIGYYILGNYFPRQYGMLFSASGTMASLPPLWECNLIGIHAGEVAAVAVEQAGLPGILRDVIRMHHAPELGSQSVSSSCRVLAMIVQAADLLANALFPGDPILTPLAPMGRGFDSAMRRADFPSEAVVEKARKIVADLLTEMAYLFPQSTTRSCYYRHEPLARVLYYMPVKPYFDVVKVFLDVRSEAVVDFTLARDGDRTGAAPLVVNLMHVEERAARVETMNSLMSLGMLTGRRAVVLVGTVEQELSQAFAGDGCRLIPWPSHPAHWMRWLRLSPSSGRGPAAQAVT